MNKRLDNGELVPVSERCPKHAYRHLLQKPERQLYRCTCAWDACTAAQLAAGGAA